MNFTGVFINAFCVAVAGIMGAFFRKGLPEKMKRTLMLALGLCVLYVGITGIVKGMDSVMLVLSVAIGVIIGEAIDFDAAFNKLGMYAERKLPSESGSVADGFVSATLFVCVGAMAIVGGIESGTKGTYSTFLAKSCIDTLVVFKSEQESVHYIVVSGVGTADSERVQSVDDNFFIIHPYIPLILIKPVHTPLIS